jgi:hypothetical protein
VAIASSVLAWQAVSEVMSILASGRARVCSIRPCLCSIKEVDGGVSANGEGSEVVGHTADPLLRRHLLQ